MPFAPCPLLHLCCTHPHRFTKVVNEEKANQFGQGDDAEKKKPGYLTPPASMRNMVRRASAAAGRFGTEN